MARLLVVSRSMALALRLADTHDVVEASVDHLATLRPAPHLDAVVLDVGEPALAVATIDRLRRDGDTTPLLVVSGYQAAWAGLSAIDVPGVVVVPLPVTRAALLEGIDRLLATPGPLAPETDPDGSPGACPGAAQAGLAAGWQGGGFDWWDGEGPDGGTRVLDLSDGTSELSSRPLRRGWPPQAPAAIPAGAPPDSPARIPAPGPASGGTRPGGAPGPAPDLPALVDALVSALAGRAGELMSVTDAARAVADRASAAARAAACAVLLPDGDTWRVGGGHGLRAVERTMALDRSHWLVEAVLSADRPILLGDTDVARRPGGVPLAAWRHLLVAPVPRVRVLVVLARAGDGDPFGPADAGALTGPLTEAAPLLRTAMQARNLARLLAPLRDVPPQP